MAANFIAASELMDVRDPDSPVEWAISLPNHARPDGIFFDQATVSRFCINLGCRTLRIVAEDEGAHSLDIKKESPELIPSRVALADEASTIDWVVINTFILQKLSLNTDYARGGWFGGTYTKLTTASQVWAYLLDTSLKSGLRELAERKYRGIAMAPRKLLAQSVLGMGISIVQADLDIR